MVHPLPNNLYMYSLRLVSTLAITTHPRCCEDCARLVADKVANGKEPKEARRPAPHIIAIATWRSPDLEHWTVHIIIYNAMKPCREAPRQMSIFLRCALYPRARKVGSAAGPTFVRAHAQGEHAQGEHAERRVKADVAVRAGAR